MNAIVPAEDVLLTPLHFRTLFVLADPFLNHHFELAMVVNVLLPELAGILLELRQSTRSSLVVFLDLQPTDDNVENLAGIVRALRQNCFSDDTSLRLHPKTSFAIVSRTKKVSMDQSFRESLI